MNKTLMDKIKKLCKASYPPHNWEGHLIPVVNIALRLCDEYRGDKDIAEAGAYLHDIGRVKFDYLKILGIVHEVSGYYYSRYKLWQYHCPKGEREKICRCVLTHSSLGLSQFSPETLEEQIVMNADAISHFEQYLYLLAIHYSDNKKNLKESKQWVLKKLKKSWDNKLTLSDIKEKIEPLYEKIKQELGATNDG